MQTGIVGLPDQTVMSVEQVRRVGGPVQQASAMQRLLQCPRTDQLASQVWPVDVISQSKARFGSWLSCIACAGLLGAFCSTSAVGWTRTRTRTGPYSCRLGCSMSCQFTALARLPGQKFCWSDICLLQRFAELRVKFPDFLDVDEQSFMAAISNIRV